MYIDLMTPWRRTAAVVVVLCLMVPAALSAGGGRETSSPAVSKGTAEITARFEYVAGAVTLDGQDAAIGDSVGRDSVVQTGPDGTADIVFGTGNALRIEENTRLSLDLVDPSVGLDIRNGAIAAVFNGLESVGTGPDDTFRVQTPSTIAGVRGTAFYIKIEDADNTYVCTCHGILEFAESGLVVRAAKHAATRFTRSNGDVSATPASEEYHDTEGLNAVADVAGVTIAWGEEP